MPTGPDPILLLTRPLPDSQQVAARMGWPAIVSPVIEIVPVDHDTQALARAQGLVFTSAHAVGAAGPGRGRPAICVGARTAEAAWAAGFAVQVGGGNATSLLSLIGASPVPLIHPHGRHLAQPLPVRGIVVYDQQPLPLTPQARAALQGRVPVICPLYSARSARLLSGQVAGLAREGPLAPLWVVAISPAANAAWCADAGRRCTAAGPSAPEMEAAIRRIAAAEQS